ncbi:phosphatase [Christensenellaceae bacterium OttesenSCG-928-K19]|nr:phosphatase [Christensenellaceae bacterium OttesenSCG-928-K19]
MRLLVDTHTHTVASAHAYSTLRENAQLAFEKGLEGFVCADHGSGLEFCAPNYILTSALQFIPEMIEGVRLIKGVELNIVDFEGTVDVGEKQLKVLEFVIASIHDEVTPYIVGTVEQNTAAMVNAIRNPYVDVIGHPGNPAIPIDAETLVKETAKQGKMVEVNNHSFEARAGSGENCLNIIKLCKKHDVRITVSSDAHSCYNVGTFQYAIQALEECGYPEELVVSATLERFMGYMKERKR